MEYQSQEALKFPRYTHESECVYQEIQVTGEIFNQCVVRAAPGEKVGCHAVDASHVLAF